MLYIKQADFTYVHANRAVSEYTTEKAGMKKWMIHVSFRRLINIKNLKKWMGLLTGK
jgi:hypothetical protein